jgi:hypothetical protein
MPYRREHGEIYLDANKEIKHYNSQYFSENSLSIFSVHE